MGIGTMSETTLANCGICESTIMREMQEGCYVDNNVLPEQYKSKKSKMVNVAKLFAKLDQEEQERTTAKLEQDRKTSKMNRLAVYAEHCDSIEYPITTTIEDELRIDAAYVRCYADFIKLGILEPISHDELMDFEDSGE
jgi:hypothetical protein